MYIRIKRLLDIIGAVAGLIAAGPVMLAIACVLLRTMGRPILFRQRRVGWREQSFVCLKFRTLTEERDQDGRLLSNEKRLTPVGLVLRRTSLDELPQLWNILVGGMSFVGPRPLPERYLQYYTVAERRRHSVRPGLTGWAQIHGRNRLSFDERLAMDVWYVDHLSWLLDLKILLATVRVVLTRGDVVFCQGTLDEERGGLSASVGAKER